MPDAAHVDAPEDRFCDLVMKGGITSGVVYPKAIALLSRHYRFKSIGGTSAGAIAAAVTAAAEFQRRNGRRAGFDRLERLPEELQAKVPGTNKSKLLSLFQPQRGPHRLFSVLISSLNSGGTWRRVFTIVRGFLLAYWPATLASVLVALAAGYYGQGVLAAILLFGFAGLGSIGYWVYRDLTRAVVENGFGLCTGMTEDPQHEALTPWLHEQIQAAAGLGPQAAPLTFGQLWDVDGFPPQWLKLPEGTKPRSIDLQMFSTNLAHGRPYVFPLPEVDPAPSRFRDRERLYFKPDELRRYLPPDVVDWMAANSNPYAVEPGRAGKDPDAKGATDLRELPSARNFPVLLAARMSLSFPLLFCAVPLWAVDHDAPPGKREMRRCWFSDGGISSNFPMHLFDGLLPLWPTFGVNLEGRIPYRPDMVYLPERYEEGHGERWNRFAEDKKSATRFGGFLSAIVGTMQNWNDNSLARMPGVRDRVARVRLDPQEGGMNLNMKQEDIDAIASRGEDAARQLIDRFAAQPPGGAQTAGWNEHRWVRLNVLLRMIEARAPGVMNALSRNCAHATDFDTLIADAMAAVDAAGGATPATGYEAPLSEAEQKALRSVLRALNELVEALSTHRHDNPFKPIPVPELRVRPPL